MSSFHERQKNLFDHLKEAEDQCGFSKLSNTSIQQDYGVIDKQTYRKLKHVMKPFKRKESIFKRPEANIRDCLQAKTVPGYMKHPKKWVYYSLSDVTLEQMSDATNTATALSFIREMEEREAANIQTEPTTEGPDAVFKKPIFKVSKTLKIQSGEPEQAIHKGNKIIMPEYVVGISKKKEKKNAKKENLRSTDSEDKAKKVELKLNHLYEEDDCADLD